MKKIQKKVQLGFTMVEMMIAVVVVAIGLLGVAGMQARALSDNKGAETRTLSTYLVYDMVDRMRANIDGVNSGFYDNIDTSLPYMDPGCISADCTAALLMEYDAFRWKEELYESLHGGLGFVERDGDGTFFVAVMWDDKRTGATGTGCNPEDPADMKCYSLRVQL